VTPPTSTHFDQSSIKYSHSPRAPAAPTNCCQSLAGDVRRVRLFVHRTTEIDVSATRHICVLVSGPAMSIKVVVARWKTEFAQRGVLLTCATSFDSRNRSMIFAHNCLEFVNRMSKPNNTFSGAPEAYLLARTHVEGSTPSIQARVSESE